MPISLRIPPEKEAMIQEAIAKTGKTKTAYILEAVDEKLGLVEDREQKVRKLAGWLSQGEADELRESVDAFNRVDEADWE